MIRNMKIQIISEKDFNSINYGWNTTSPIMSSLSPCITHGELMTHAKFQFFSLRNFGENIVHFFSKQILCTIKRDIVKI